MKKPWIYLIFCASLLFCSSAQAKDRMEEIVSLCVGEDVLDYIREKIEKTPVEESPFPHFIIEDILPETLYEAGQSFWPHPNCFYAKGFPHHGPVHRLHVCTSLGSIEHSSLTPEQKMFWRTFGEVVVNHYMKPLIAQKLLNYIHYKFPGATPEQLNALKKSFEFYPFHYDSLLIDDANYFIDPHVDGVKTFAQCLLYFPEDNDHQDLGTKFFRGPPFRKGHYNSCVAALKLEKHVRYKRNTLVVFLQSPTSWHSADTSPYPDTHYLRKMFLMTLRTSPEAVNQIYNLQETLTDWYYQDFNQVNPRE
ncbi:MAG: hypothetical protein KDK64_06050 [Chlamydiia bacterium]|nr:hypothetical protein [Chlamydiia bacterium]